MNNHSTTTPWSVHLRLLGMIMFWGASYSWAKTVVATVPPITAATLRFFLASFALFVWLHRLRRTRQLLTISARQWAGLTLAAISGIVLYTMCFMIALRHIDAGRAAVLFALSPVLTLLLAAWLFHEKLNTLIVTGILLAVVGSAIVIAHGNPLTLLRGHIGIGEWLIFASIFLWTGYTLIGRKMLGGMDALSTTVATLLDRCRPAAAGQPDRGRDGGLGDLATRHACHLGRPAGADLRLDRARLRLVFRRHSRPRRGQCRRLPDPGTRLRRPLCRLMAG